MVDASYIIRGFTRGPRNRHRFSNPDRWARFWKRVRERGGKNSLTFQKIKSHLTTGEILSGLAPFGDVALNHAADEFAEIASARAQLPPNILKDFKYMVL